MMVFLVWIVGFAATHVYVERNSKDTVAALASGILWPLYWGYKLVKVLGRA